MTLRNSIKHLRPLAAAIALAWGPCAPYAPALAQAVAQPKSLFASAPAPLRAYLLKARQADAIADPLARCLAFPDLPGNRWPAGLAAAYCHDVYDPHLSLQRIGELLDRKKVVELERLFQADLDRHFSSADFSEIIHRDFNNFSDVTAEADRLSGLWLKLSPRSPFAMNARATYLSALAWQTRGTLPAATTSAARMELKALPAGAAADLFREALEIQPRLMSAYSELMAIDVLQSDGQGIAAAYRRASGVAPGCRVVEQVMMQNLLPRWGGSHEQMDAFGVTLAPLLKKRPLLTNVLVLSQYDRGAEPMLDRHYDAAATQFAPAASRSPYVPLQQDMVRSLARAARPDNWKILAHAMTVYRYDDDNAELARLRGRALLAAGDNEWAQKALRRADSIKPDDAAR